MTRLDQGPQRNSVRPAADFLFESAAKVFGSKVMGIVLTGMGEDGLDGARAVKTAGGGVMIQNQESCVVFGMPGAVFAAGAFDAQGDLTAIQSMLQRMAFE
jgi:two-component system chemotaxis response regulator CheB